jgi:hypothetical protein
MIFLRFIVGFAGGGVEIVAGFGGGIFFAAALAPAPPPPLIQTMLCGFVFFNPPLQRTSPVIRTTCAAPISTTLRQNRQFFGIAILPQAL